VLIPDDAVRNLIRQAKIEQVYSVMQTSGKKGMQTMEQALCELVVRGAVTEEVALARASKPEQLRGLLQRGVYAASSDDGPIGGLRAAG